MKHSQVLIWIFCTLFLFGCSQKTSAVKKQPGAYQDRARDVIVSDNAELTGLQNELFNALEKKTPAKPEIEPLMPVYNPLEDQIISFSMVQEDLQIILYSLAQAVGMNLIIDPGVSMEERRLTLNFEKATAAAVLSEVLGANDLYYEVDKNVIRVQPFQERIFKLRFLDTEVSTSFDVGGDVFGASETDTSSGLSGSFRLKGKQGKGGNSYDAIENQLKKVISKGGTYSLNRLSGSLYVKDSPAVIRSVTRLINHFQEMMSRQILIEARIIEVVLSDKYEYGIEWNSLRSINSTAREINLNNAAWSSGTGMVLGGVFENWTLNATVDALNTFGNAKVISNPSIRSKHGKPSMISVGTSFTYVKSVETTSSSTTTTSENTTDIEVSTVFDGLILGVIPFIEDDRRISLLINPIKSDVDKASLEPEAAGGGTQKISLPEVNVKEISTTIALESGDVVILGGLIDKEQVNSKKEVPLLADIPVIGYFFKNNFEIEEVKELVIILSVTIL
ncbi:MAG: pilus (MSHA type) biogenesis protein MshL [Desulfobacterales bacterium]|nr:pilus (MSHA type) biogenesis protein MshL [Desulfobacterales bacterium]